MGEEMMKNTGAGPIPTSWKLYDNPHYSSPHHNSSPTSSPHNHFPNCRSRLKSSLATLLRPMDCDGAPSDLEVARAQVRELKAELEMERRMRRRAESVGRALAKELAEERSARAAAEALCGRLAEKVARGKEEAERVAHQVEKERRMLRVAEVLREERVQMKLAEARLLMEEKIRQIPSDTKPNDKENNNVAAETPSTTAATSRSENTTSVSTSSSQQWQQKREVENPHIKRGIKGFVEFPKVARARPNYTVAGAGKEGKSHKSSGSTNLVECQKAQLRILLRQRNPAPALGVVGASGNLVM